MADADAAPGWIGLYPVDRIDRYENGFRFLIWGSGFLDPVGFAYASEGEPPVVGEGYGTPEEYLELASLGGDAGLPIVGMQVAAEDDGFNKFAVTTTDPIDAAYAEVLSRARVNESTIACATGPGEFEMAVIIAPFSEFNGVTADSCPASNLLPRIAGDQMPDKVLDR